MSGFVTSKLMKKFILNMLPTNEFLLTMSDVCHNFLKTRKYDTLAVGAVGSSPFKVKLVLGINSSVCDDSKLTKDRIVPPAIRNSPIVKRLDMEILQEPYHAETSIALYAKDRNLKIFGLASSRKICEVCDSFLKRHGYLFDSDCVPVDAWEHLGRTLTQKEREDIITLDSVTVRHAKAIRES